MTTTPSGVPTTVDRSSGVWPLVRMSWTDGESTRPSHSTSSQRPPKS